MSSGYAPSSPVYNPMEGIEDEPVKDDEEDSLDDFEKAFAELEV